MVASILSATPYGMNGVVVKVETDISPRGLPGFKIVGLPSKAVDESRVRVRSALINSGFSIPYTFITVNLAPAHMKKDGSLFDLPIALSILCAQKKTSREHNLSNSTFFGKAFIGELSLNGDVMPAVGVLPILLSISSADVSKIYIPEGNVPEVEAILGKRNIGAEVFGVRSLSSLVTHLNRGDESNDGVRCIKVNSTIKGPDKPQYKYDFAHINGQDHVKRALEISAAGGHNIHLYGPPGTGKTLLARALPSILPDLDDEEFVEVALVNSISRFAIPPSMRGHFDLRRPFRAPHHSTTLVGLVGGGAHITPGEISLAHRGVLFLDEFPEFSRSVIESLRQPIEDGFILITRNRDKIEFPCTCILVVASNPCPCGWADSDVKECVCGSAERLRYQKKLSGPMIDRIDIHVQVPYLRKIELTSAVSNESSLDVKERVVKARDIQKERFRFAGSLYESSVKNNGEMSSALVKKICQVDKRGLTMLREASERLSLSPRAFFKVIKVAQTISDLNASDEIKAEHIAEAIQYRSTL